MQKLLSLIMVFILLISLCACSKPAQNVSLGGESIAEPSEPKPAQAAGELNFIEAEIGGIHTANGNGQIYTYEAQGLVCYNSAGEKLWNKSIPGIFDSGAGYRGVVESRLFPSDGGVIFLHTYVNGERLCQDIYSIDSSGNERWKTQLDEWINVTDCISDGNDGMIISGNREVSMHNGGSIVLAVNANGEIYRYENFPKMDETYIHRGIYHMSYNKESADIYGVMNEDSDGLYEFRSCVVKINTKNGDIIINDELTNIKYICALKNGGCVAVANSAVYVLDEALSLTCIHEYPEVSAYSAYSLPDGRYMVYLGTDAQHEGHKMHIYGADGKMVREIDLGAVLNNFYEFENGFIAGTYYLGNVTVYRYNYQTDVLESKTINTDAGEIKAADFNTVFYKIADNWQKPYGKK